MGFKGKGQKKNCVSLVQRDRVLVWLFYVSPGSNSLTLSHPLSHTLFVLVSVTIQKMVFKGKGKNKKMRQSCLEGQGFGLVVLRQSWLTLSHTLSHSLTLSHILSHSLTHSHTLSHTLIHSHTLSHSLILEVPRRSQRFQKMRQSCLKGQAFGLVVLRQSWFEVPRGSQTFLEVLKNALVLFKGICFWFGCFALLSHSLTFSHTPERNGFFQKDPRETYGFYKKNKHEIQNMVFCFQSDF